MNSKWEKIYILRSKYKRKENKKNYILNKVLERGSRNEAQSEGQPLEYCIYLQQLARNCSCLERQRGFVLMKIKASIEV